MTRTRRLTIACWNLAARLCYALADRFDALSDLCDAAGHELKRCPHCGDRMAVGILCRGDHA